MKIKVGIYNFVNNLPIFYTLSQLEISIKVYRYPIDAFDGLKNNEVTHALIPTIIYNSHKKDLKLSKLSVASNGPILSLLLILDVEIENINHHTILLSNISYSTNKIIKVIFNQLGYKMKYTFDKNKRYIGKIIIGDEALKNNEPNKYIYDIGTLYEQIFNSKCIYALLVSYIDQIDIDVDTVIKNKINYLSYLGKYLFKIDERLLYKYFQLIKYKSSIEEINNIINIINSIC